ncbi:MAG: DegT/DnrJ/EryC1/StrS family aminotransferase [Ignavibacteria bacterium]|nr:DegT/DnrJ/EryC1/StrS family aminotransferase [Ignavibacteria bacterium]
MNIPFIDFKKLHDPIKEEINTAIQKIIDNNSFILGKAVSDFENEFAKAHDVKHCIGVSSGTDANHLALWALGIKAGDEVIIPANTFIATAWGATLCGATPVFVDCDSESYNIDPKKIEEIITPKTKAIVAVHLYGQPAEMEELKKIADKHNLFLIEDAAQSHIAEYKGRKIGGLSRVASFSFYPGKNLGAFGEGGAVTTNDDEIALKVKMLRDHGSVKKYYHESYGHNYRMEGIQGAVLGVKLKYLKDWTQKRRAAAKKYIELLKDVKQIKLPSELSDLSHVYHLFVIQTPDRDNLQKFLNENEISNGLHYPIPLHLQKCFEHLGYKKGDFPVTEKLADECLSLPMFPHLTDEQIEFVCNKIKEFYKE